MVTRTIETRTHGRYLVDPPSAGGPSPLLIGFHGYAEGADAALARLRRIRGAERWCLAAIQGLNRFYQRRTDEVIAGWMTRQDRELAIADNIRYVQAAVDAIAREWRAESALVFAGFSQGTAMAFRAAASAVRAVAGVVAVGGDIPPEISDEELRHVGRILLCRGRSDEWYTAAKLTADLARLRHAGIEPQCVEYDGGHEWNDLVVAAVDGFVEEVAR